MYTMGCPPVRGDNLRILASGLTYVQVDKHGITILYHLHQCRPCTSREITMFEYNLQTEYKAIFLSSFEELAARLC